MQENGSEWPSSYAIKPPSLIKNPRQHSLMCGSGRKAPGDTKVRDYAPPACVEWGLVPPEGPTLLASAFHLWLHFTQAVLHRQLWGGSGHNTEKRKSSDNQGLRYIHLDCYCYVLHKRQMSLCNPLFFIAIVYRCLWDQNKALQGPSL